MDIKKVTVIGAGIMGKQIALNSAIYGYSVVLCDTSKEALKKAEEWKNEWLAGRVQKGKLKEEKISEINSNIEFIIDIAYAVRDTDLVIEAIVEKEEIKRELFKQLDTLTKPEAILASNSSFIPSSLIADVTNKPDKVANLHYFNPALVMKLVEVVKGDHTSMETANALYVFAKNTGKEPILLKKEIDGFVANRVLSKIVSEAYYLVEQGIVTPQEVDIALEHGLNHPMGPFKIMDFSGIDLAYLAKQRRYEKTGNPEDKPPKLLEEKYNKGEFGRKTGKGWYDYTK